MEAQIGVFELDCGHGPADRPVQRAGDQDSHVDATHILSSSPQICTVLGSFQAAARKDCRWPREDLYRVSC